MQREERVVWRGVWVMRVERGVGDAGRHLEEDSTSNARVTMAIVESVGGAGAEESKAGT